MYVYIYIGLQRYARPQYDTHRDTKVTIRYKHIYTQSDNH
jgi:hypothetical protein